MTEPKRHHYVPQMHLRRFSVDAARIVQFDKETGRIEGKSIRAAAMGWHYYTFPTDRGPSVELERRFGDIEAHAARAIDRLCHLLVQPKYSLAIGDREWLAAYVALLHLRVPAQRERTLGVRNFTATIHLDMALSNPEAFARIAREKGLADNDQEIEKLRTSLQASLRGGKVEVVSDLAASIPFIAEALPIVTGLVHRMNWVIAKRFEPPFFVVSDNPVVLWTMRQLPPRMGIGFATPGVEVTVALAKDTMLIATNEEIPETMVVLDREMTLHMNRRTWIQATQFVYAATAEDLQATRAFLQPGEDRLRLATVQISSGPSEWRVYAERAKQRTVVPAGPPPRGRRS